MREVNIEMGDKQHILAVPNFSEGVRDRVISEVVAAVRIVPTVKIISVEPEANFNRTVLTFIIEVSHAVDVMVRMAEVIFTHIHMEEHEGSHPRIGALDILPIFPLKNITIEETTELAATIGASLFKQTKVPIYYSGLNAKTKHKKSIPFIRKGQYEGLKALLKEGTSREIEERSPDLSVSNQLDNEKGATIVMASKECPIAYNVFIASENVEDAKEIARFIKHPDRGFRSIKSIGFKDKGKAGTAVSMNIFNAEETPLAVVRSYIQTFAKERGTYVIAAEIIGPVRRDVLLEAAMYDKEENPENDERIIHLLKEQMNLIGFQKKQIIEYHLDGGRE